MRGSETEIQRSLAAGPTVSGNGSLSDRSAVSLSLSVAWAAAAAASTFSGIAAAPSVTVHSPATVETYPSHFRRAQRAQAGAAYQFQSPGDHTRGNTSPKVSRVWPVCGSCSARPGGSGTI